MTAEDLRDLLLIGVFAGLYVAARVYELVCALRCAKAERARALEAVRK